MQPHYDKSKANVDRLELNGKLPKCGCDERVPWKSNRIASNATQKKSIRSNGVTTVWTYPQIERS